MTPTSSSFSPSKILTTTIITLSSPSKPTSSFHHRRTIVSSTSRLVPHPPDLIRWVQKQGGFVHPNLKLSSQSSSGLELISTAHIPNGSDLISLPNHIPLRFHSNHPDSGSTSLLHQLASRVPEELWAMKLGLRLLQERAEVGSFWWPYISNLPETFTVPIFFSGEDIKSLQYAPLLHQVNKRCRFLLEFEKEVRRLLEGVPSKDHPFEGQAVNASSLGWAMSAVSSRAFRLHGGIFPNGKHDDIPMMLPLIDMCNHNFHPNARIVQEQDTSNSNTLVKVVAEIEIEQNTPITLNYGGLSNDLLLLDYGFVISSNPFDYVELKYDGNLLEAASMAAGVSSPSFSSPAPWQQEILSQLNLLGDAALLKVTLGGPGLVDGRLLAALRVLISSNKEAVLNHDMGTLMSLSEVAPLGPSLETAVLRTVIALCVVALEHFPTKIMQDESILKGGVSSSMELAVQFRKEKKFMIMDVMRKLSKRVKMLSKEKSAGQS